MRTKKEYVRKRDAWPCKYCGALVIWRRYNSGAPRLAELINEGTSFYVIAGAGNHFNLKPSHDCRSEAKRIVNDYQRKVAEIEPTIKRIEDSKQLLDVSEVPEVFKAGIRRELESLPGLKELVSGYQKSIGFFQRRADGVLHSANSAKI